MAAFDYSASGGGFRRAEEGAATKDRAAVELGREVGREIGRELGLAEERERERPEHREHHEHDIDPRRLREEIIDAFKVYDQCRWQDCLTGEQIGPARSAETVEICGVHYTVGEAVTPPINTASVTSDDLRVVSVDVVDKRPSPFKKGYWDVNLKFVIAYDLKFYQSDGTLIGTLCASSVYNKKVCLFGSTNGDTLISTDIAKALTGYSATLAAAPFILVESKAVALSADIRPVIGIVPTEYVFVTIGLFAVAQIFRIVQLSVESRGFAVPPRCHDCDPVNPCDFFTGLDFPLDIFAPPQKPEFNAGFVNSIPPEEAAAAEAVA